MVSKKSLAYLLVASAIAGASAQEVPEIDQVDVTVPDEKPEPPPPHHDHHHHHDHDHHHHHHHHGEHGDDDDYESRWPGVTEISVEEAVSICDEYVSELCSHELQQIATAGSSPLTAHFKLQSCLTKNSFNIPTECREAIFGANIYTHKPLPPKFEEDAYRYEVISACKHDAKDLCHPLVHHHFDKDDLNAVATVGKCLTAQWYDVSAECASYLEEMRFDLPDFTEDRPQRFYGGGEALYNDHHHKHVFLHIGFVFIQIGVVLFVVSKCVRRCKRRRKCCRERNARCAEGNYANLSDGTPVVQHATTVKPLLHETELSKV